MKSFDVVVVGAGPAGGHCARLLAKAGHKVLLIERSENFNRNSFSSAGTPLETLKKFELPDEVVGSLWKKIIIVTTNLNESWDSEQPLGAVLDFSKLREFLADEVRSHGGEVWMGCRYIKYVQTGEHTLVFLQPNSGREEITIGTKILVDATGPARAVMYEKASHKPQFIRGTGIEYLIEVEPQIYNNYSEALTFFLGHKWMPKGYSWIFPMEQNRLKVGAGLIKSNHQVVKHTESLKYYIELIIKEYMNLKEYKLIDIHGSTLQYNKDLTDIYYKDNLIAIGDAVSTVNFLGGEGIRHAMHSSEIAIPYIQKYLRKELVDFRDYQQEMHKIFYINWKLSERLGNKKYLEDNDELINKTINYLKFLTVEDLIDILFYYDFKKFSKGLRRRILKKLDSFLKNIVRSFRVS